MDRFISVFALALSRGAPFSATAQAEPSTASDRLNRIEDRIDRREDRRDRRENVRDRMEDIRDRREDHATRLRYAPTLTIPDFTADTYRLVWSRRMTTW